MGTYEFNGEKYQQASKHQKGWGSKLMADLELKGDETILDLGCGDGVLTERLALSVPNGSVVGIDASAGMIRTAEKRARENLKFVLMDVDDMAFEGAFDAIYSNAALHWVKNHERLLKNSFRALKPGGRILWNFGGKGNCLHFCETVRESMRDARYEAYFREFVWPWYMPEKTEYESKVERVGFSVSRVTEENADRFFTDAEEMIKWIDQPCIVPFLEQIPDDKKQAFREGVIEGMLKRTLQPDGTCFETFRRIRVFAVK